MRASTAFFAGMGTVVVAIASGVSGGAWIADMMNPGLLPRQVMETPRRHRQTSPQRMFASGTVPYVPATLAFTDPSIDRGAAARDPSQAKIDVIKKQVSPAVQSAVTAAANGSSVKPAGAPSSKAVTTAARPPAAGTRDADLNRVTERRRVPDRHRYQPRAAQGQYRQQQSRKAGRGQANSAQQARNDGRRTSSGRAYSGQRYPGGRFRDESSAKHRAADRRYHDGPDPRYWQYDSRPRYAERPAPFPLPPTGLFGPD